MFDALRYPFSSLSSVVAPRVLGKLMAIFSEDCLSKPSLYTDVLVW